MATNNQKTTTTKKGTFETLSAIDLSGRTSTIKQRSGQELTYLDWAAMIDILSRTYPDFSFRIITFDENGIECEGGLPYQRLGDGGFYVHTEMTIDGVSKRMWLPVMDAANNAMKDKPYQISRGGGRYTTDVQAATSFDFNKNTMRCLVKNAALFGLGLNIYMGTGEDLPDVNDDKKVVEPSTGVMTEVAQNPDTKNGLVSALNEAITLQGTIAELQGAPLGKVFANKSENPMVSAESFLKGMVEKYNGKNREETPACVRAAKYVLENKGGLSVDELVAMVYERA